MIHLSAAASQEICRLRSALPSSKESAHVTHPVRFRLRVQSGGCEDFFYDLSFEDGLGEGDRLHACGEVEAIIDDRSFPMINGLAIDYSEDLMGGGFRFNNPNATKNCGCGNSFAVAKDWEI